jgi:integrase
MSKPWKQSDGVYRFNYTNAKGKRTSGYGCTDLDATKRIMAKVEHEAFLARKGLIDPREQGFIDAEKKPLTEHAKEWSDAMEARKVGDKHARQMKQCIDSVIASASVSRLSQFSADTVQRAIASLASTVRGEVRISRGLATLNRYIVAAKAFGAWLTSDKRTRENGLKSLKKYRAETDRKRRRRALSADEANRLITAAENGPAIRGMSGRDRAMMYRLALGTGFRVSEIASLTPESFDLNTQHPTITVQAAHSKHRREDVQPIAKTLATVLNPWLSGREPGEPVFALPESSNTAKMMRVDLLAAGIEYLTSDGVADVHALRHSFITALAMSGERIKVVQELARHSKADLTLNVYTHTGLHDLQGAVDRLPVTDAPKFERPKMRVTGTDGRMDKNPRIECMQTRGFSGHLRSTSGTDANLLGGTESPGFSEAKDASECQEMQWSDGESNPDLLNAIQPSSR